MLRPRNLRAGGNDAPSVDYLDCAGIAGDGDKRSPTGVHPNANCCARHGMSSSCEWAADALETHTHCTALKAEPQCVDMWV
ncbi:MAG: hypothetical protein NVS4B3_10750 [Gemmatimonadaceae bacterium]